MKNETSNNKHLLPLLYQPIEPHQTRRTRTINGETHERERISHSTWTRAKHDLAQPKTPSSM